MAVVMLLCKSRSIASLQASKEEVTKTINQSAADRLFKDTGISQHGLPESETVATFPRRLMATVIH